MFRFRMMFLFSAKQEMKETRDLCLMNYPADVTAVKPSPPFYSMTYWKLQHLNGQVGTKMYICHLNSNLCLYLQFCFLLGIRRFVTCAIDAVMSSGKKLKQNYLSNCMDRFSHKYKSYWCLYRHLCILPVRFGKKDLWIANLISVNR